MWMDLENIMLSEMLYGITYMWDLKNNPNESIYKTETDSQTWKINLWLPKGKGGWGGINEELGINIYTPLYTK